MANIDNIDREALRDAFTRYAHNEIDIATKRYRRAGEAMNLSGRYSAGDSVLTIDPLVKYRFAGREAIDDLEFSEAVNANPDRTWSDSRYHTPFFTQGVPYWGIADMVMKGVGTNIGHEPSNPFLIATYGDDWISSATGENLELSKEDIDKKAVANLAKQRGLTPDKIKTIEGFLGESEHINKNITRILQNIEAKDVAHRRKIPEGQIKASDYLERSATIPELEYLLKQHRDLTRRIHKFSPELSTHILGDPSKGILSWAEQFARTSSNPSTQAIATYLESTKAMEELFPPKIHDFKKPWNERTSWGKAFLARYPEMALSPVWGDYSPDLQRLHKLRNSINANNVSLSNVLDTTDLTPQEFGLVQNQDGSYGVIPTVKTGLKNREPFYLDVSSDEDLFKKIKEGKATSAEISRAFGLGALGNTGYRTSIGDERLDYMAFPNDNIETMPSVNIPKATGGQPFKIPASSVQLANRPFAVWEWSGGKFNLINEGNNNPIGGSKPIPTKNIPKKGVYPDFTNARVEDLFRRYSRKGFVDAGALTKPFKSLGQYMAEVPFPEIPAGAVVPKGAQIDYLATMRHNYLNNPEYRMALNANTLGKLGTAAAIVTTPFDSINRRNSYEKYLVDNGATTDDLAMARIPVGVASGLETAANFATFGLYDAFSPSISAQANRQAAEDEFYRDLALRKYIQQGIDYPVIGGQRFERTTK